MYPLRIIFAGSGEFGVPTLNHIIDSDEFKLEMVISQPDRPAGRGRAVMPTPIAQLALRKGLPLERTENINRMALPDADAMVVIAFGQKISPRVVKHARLGAVNLHASLLPRHRGAAPINWALLAGDKVTGNSVIRLAEKMDAGAIINQSKLEIGDLNTAGEIHDRLALDGVKLLDMVLQDLDAGFAVETTQDESLATVAPKLTRDMTKIDWTKSADEIAGKIRGLYPWPGCRVKLLSADGKELDRVTLVRARAADFYYSHEQLVKNGLPLPKVTPGELGNPFKYRPGTPDRVSAGCGRAIEIIEIQPEGKRPMPLVAYKNGNRWESGMRLESI